MEAITAKKVIKQQEQIVYYTMICICRNEVRHYVGGDSSPYCTGCRRVWKFTVAELEAPFFTHIGYDCPYCGKYHNITYRWGRAPYGIICKSCRKTKLNSIQKNLDSLKDAKILGG